MRTICHQFLILKRKKTSHVTDVENLVFIGSKTKKVSGNYLGLKVCPIGAEKQEVFLKKS
jgi:hypothetical protein